MEILYKIRLLSSYVLLVFAVSGCQIVQDKNNINVTHRLRPTKSGYIAVQDGELFYQRFGAGKPIIVVHGGPGLDQGYLLPQMLELAKDHELIFYDQRGSGQSLKASIDSKYVTVDYFAKDLDMLKTKLGLQQVILLGHSWGGFLSMQYAIKYPKNIDALILLSSSPADYRGRKKFIDEFNIKTKSIKRRIEPLSQYELLAKLNNKQMNQTYRDLFSVYFQNPANVDQLTLKMNKDSILSGFNVLALMFKTSYFKPGSTLLPELHKMKVPTLIIHGNQDLIPVEAAQSIQSAIPGAKAVYLNDCGHFPYIEQPSVLFSSIRSFLSTVAARQQ